MHLIERLRFVAGASSAAAPLEITPPALTVLVGPNNSGKTLALHEIGWHITANEPKRSKVIAEVSLRSPETLEEAKQLIKPFLVDAPQGGDSELMWIARPNVGRSDSQNFGINPGSFGSAIGNPTRRTDVLNWCVRPHYIDLDARQRFALLDAQQITGFQQPAVNLLDALLRDSSALARVNQSVSREFKHWLVIDPTQEQTRVYAKMSLQPPIRIGIPPTKEELRYFRETVDVQTFGDGVQAYVALLAGTLALPNKIILIDEAEAFLHPTLARSLGAELAGVVAERDAQVIAATHSSDFLMGCVQAGAPTSIVRLGYTGNRASAKSIGPDEVIELASDPLMRSVGSLRGIFHRAVIVSESEEDRAFYDEINYRLRREGRGVGDALFLHAQNWQTIPRMIRPLRNLGVPAVGIMDFDTIPRDEKWGEICNAIGMSVPERNAVGELRVIVKKALVGTDYKKRGLRTINDDSARDSVVQLLKLLAERGLFIVPIGELECWLENIHLPRGSGKKLWLLSMFAALGTDPSSSNYVHASVDDVWQFLDNIEKWVADPDRLGMP